MPAVRIVDNVQLEANYYYIKIKEIDAGHGIVYAGQFMAMDPMGGAVNLPGHQCPGADLRPARDLDRCRPAGRGARCAASPWSTPRP
jgi:hypothetical protein